MRYSNEELVAEIDRVAEIVNQAPTLSEFREHASHSATTYYRRFGSWQDALEAAGYEPHEANKRVPTPDLLEAINCLVDEDNEPPTAAEMNAHGMYEVSTYQRRFSSWNEAVKQAGYEPRTKGTPISQEDLLAEIRRLADNLGRRPTFEDMTEQGMYAAATYSRRFGSWTAAVDTALNTTDSG